MPIYEYECPKCGVVDVMQKITDSPRKTCPTPRCRRRVKKLMSNTAFQLKGSGWYVTDYGKGGQKPSGSGGDSSSDSQSADSSTKGEAKASDSKKSDAKKSDQKKDTAKKKTAA